MEALSHDLDTRSLPRDVTALLRLARAKAVDDSDREKLLRHARILVAASPACARGLSAEERRMVEDICD
jgi:hypothetical protein